jgi:hypothetical protein
MSCVPKIHRGFIQNSSPSVIDNPKAKKEATMSNPPISGYVQEVAREARIVSEPNAQVYAAYKSTAHLRGCWKPRYGPTLMSVEIDTTAFFSVVDPHSMMRANPSSDGVLNRSHMHSVHGSMSPQPAVDALLKPQRIGLCRVIDLNFAEFSFYALG